LKFIHFIFILLTFLLISTAYGQNLSGSLNPDSALSAALSKMEGDPIHLADAVSLAIEQASPVREAKAAMMAARGTWIKQQGTFDPELFAEISKSSEDQPSSSPFSGADVLHPVTTAGRAGARVTLPVGTEVSASVMGTKQETNSSFASLNPQFNAVSSLTVRQPLLQGFGPAAWGDLAEAKARFQAAKQRYADALAGIKTVAESAYWDLYAAEHDLATAQLARDRGAALLNEATQRAQSGLIGPNQVNNAKVFLAQQELAVLDAEDNLTRISDELASLIGRRPGESFLRYRPLDEPPTDSSVTLPDAVLERAMQTNHQILAAEAEVKAAHALVRAARWNVLPRADVFGAIGGNGLAGSGQDVVFLSDTLHNTRNDDFGDALNQALHRRYPTWTIGLSVSVPILFRTKNGERQRLQAELDRAEARLIQVKRDIGVGVRAQLRELEHGQARLKAAQNGVQASLDQVRIGLIEFNNGRTTAFELVRLGADLADAQKRYSQALVRTAKASSRLEQLAPLPQ
jgi:outer membrane protein